MKFKRFNSEHIMGLDQYAYVAAQAGDYDSYFENNNVGKPRELAYWRKHPNLQGWMEQLWLKKGGTPDENFTSSWGSSFNGIELELTWEDLNQLEKDILNNAVASLNTEGFFFGSPKDAYYRNQDLQFIADAKAELILGLKVFYNSSW
jgi:hypothetical protein